MENKKEYKILFNGQELKRLIKFYGIKQEVLHIDLGIQRFVLYGIINNPPKDIKLSRAMMIAEYFNVPLESLIIREGKKPYMVGVKPYKTIPIYSRENLDLSHLCNNR